jgi:hypothetical protein
VRGQVHLFGVFRGRRQNPAASFLRLSFLLCANLICIKLFSERGGPAGFTPAANSWRIRSAISLLDYEVL